MVCIVGVRNVFMHFTVSQTQSINHFYTHRRGSFKITFNRLDGVEDRLQRWMEASQATGSVSLIEGMVFNLTNNGGPSPGGPGHAQRKQWLGFFESLSQHRGKRVRIRAPRV
jgi:hypothetical protein